MRGWQLGGQGKGEPLGMNTLRSLVLWGQLRKGGPEEMWRMDAGQWAVRKVQFLLSRVSGH